MEMMNEFVEVVSFVVPAIISLIAVGVAFLALVLWVQSVRNDKDNTNNKD